MRIFIIIFVLIGWQNASAQENCNDVFKVKDEFKEFNSGNTLETAHKWLKSKSFREYATNYGVGGGITIPIMEIPVGFNANSTDSDYQKLYDAIEKGDKSLRSENFINDIYKHILNPAAYPLWLECVKSKLNAQIRMEEIKAGSKGLIGIITDQTNDFFILKLKWVPTAGVNTIQLNKITVEGANYNEESFDLTETLGSEFMSIPFYRDKTKKAAIISINTVGNRGSFSIIVKNPSIKSSVKLDVSDFKFSGKGAQEDELIYIAGRGELFSAITMDTDFYSQNIKDSKISGTITLEVKNAGLNPIAHFGGEHILTYEEKNYLKEIIGTKYIFKFDGTSKLITKNNQSKKINISYTINNYEVKGEKDNLHQSLENEKFPIKISIDAEFSGDNLIGDIIFNVKNFGIFNEKFTTD